LSRIRTPISSRKGQAACETVAGKQVPAEIVTAPGDTGPYNSGDLAGADFIHTDVWVSMGEAKDVWAERIRLLAPYLGQCGLMRETRNPAAKFMHCLPADHDTNTVVAREIMEHTGMTSGLEVTDEVFRSPASILFDQAENRLRQHLAGAAGGAALAPTDGALGTGMMANPGSPCQIEGSSGGAHPLKGDAPGQGRC
jgi:hypothetical protein